MQNALELTEVGFVFSSLASLHLVVVAVMHKQVAELKELLCRSIFDCRGPKSNSVAHLSSRCYLALRKAPTY